MKLKELISKFFKISQKDTQFLFNTFVISLLVMALLFAFEPYIETNVDPKKEIIAQLDHQIVTIYPADLNKFVKSESGKPVMLVMYASWCGYCKKVMPFLVDMVKNHEIDMVDTKFVSIDDQPRLLSRYLVHKEYDNVFTPYRLSRDLLRGSYADFIYSSGSHFRGSIPYIGFFDKQGKLISDASGVVEKDDVMGVIKAIQSQK